VEASVWPAPASPTIASMIGGQQSEHSGDGQPDDREPDAEQLLSRESEQQCCQERERCDDRQFDKAHRAHTLMAEVSASPQ
jgi:hypothetical protein